MKKKQTQMILYALIAVFHPTMEGLVELSGFSRIKIERALKGLHDRVYTVEGHPCHYETKDKEVNL